MKTAARLLFLISLASTLVSTDGSSYFQNYFTTNPNEILGGPDANDD